MIYLDYNVIINIGKAKNKGFVKSYEYMKENREKFCVSYVIVEEILKSEKCNELINLVKEITSKCIWPKPTYGVEIKSIETINEILKNAINYKTQDWVDESGGLSYKVNSDIRESNKVDYSKDSGRINSLIGNEVWSLKMVQDTMKIFQLNYDELRQIDVKKENNSKLINIFSNLKNVLNASGYGFDKSEHTSISGIYDVTHMINARVCNKIVSCDVNFTKRLSAIYGLLNIETEVLKMSDFKITRNEELDMFEFENEEETLKFLKGL